MQYLLPPTVYLRCITVYVWSIELYTEEQSVVVALTSLPGI